MLFRKGVGPSLPPPAPTGSSIFHLRPPSLEVSTWQTPTHTQKPPTPKPPPSSESSPPVRSSLRPRLCGSVCIFATIL